MSNTQNAIMEKKEIDAALAAELQEILEYLQDVRKRSGYGKIVIELRAGAIVEVEVAVKRRPRTERKQSEQVL